MKDIWGPIDPARWRETPAIMGLSATDEDVNAGRAVFFLSTAPLNLLRSRFRALRFSISKTARNNASWSYRQRSWIPA